MRLRLRARSNEPLSSRFLEKRPKSEVCVGLKSPKFRVRVRIRVRVRVRMRCVSL